MLPRRPSFRVDDRDVDLADLALRKDTFVALFAARTSRWQGLQAAGLGGAIVTAIARVSGQLGARDGLFLLLASVAVVAYSTHRLIEQDNSFYQQMIRLSNVMQRLKSRRAP